MFNEKPDVRQLPLVLMMMLACTGSYAQEEENDAPQSAVKQDKPVNTNTTSADTASPTVLPEVGVSATWIKQDAVSID